MVQSRYYNWLNSQGREATDTEVKREGIKQRIYQYFHEIFGTYGRPRIHDNLIENGYIVSLES